MAANRRLVHLDKIYEFASGLSKPRSEFGEGFPFLSFKDVFHNTFVPQNLSELVKSSESERQKLSIRRGDVFLTRTSETVDELGMSCVALRDIPNATFNGFTKRLRPKSQGEVVPEYAGYVFRSPSFRDAVYAMSSLSTRASLNNEMLARLAIVLPSVGEQEAIAQTLKALDDKIELNQRMNETLEAMARVLFKSWFVRFDPVYAKIGGTDRVLAPALTDLFPNEFESSVKGEIPKGWRVASILEQARLLSGGTPKTERKEYWGGAIPWASAKDVSQCREIFLTSTERSITESGLEESATQLIPYLATAIVARGATTGRMVLLGREMAMNQTCYALCSKTKTPFVLYCQLNHEIDSLVHAAHGSVFDTITTSTFGNSSFILAPERVLSAFERLVAPYFTRLLANCDMASTLTALRDTLVPKLISGELRVKAAEKIVEAVV